MAIYSILSNQKSTNMEVLTPPTTNKKSQILKTESATKNTLYVTLKQSQSKLTVEFLTWNRTLGFRTKQSVKTLFLISPWIKLST